MSCKLEAVSFLSVPLVMNIAMTNDNHGCNLITEKVKPSIGPLEKTDGSSTTSDEEITDVLRPEIF